MKISDDEQLSAMIYALIMPQTATPMSCQQALDLLPKDAEDYLATKVLIAISHVLKSHAMHGPQLVVESLGDDTWELLQDFSTSLLTQGRSFMTAELDGVTDPSEQEKITLKHLITISMMSIIRGLQIGYYAGSSECMNPEEHVIG